MANVTLKRWDGTQWVELLPTPRAHTHAASDITSGVFSTARLATGTANSTTFLRGDSSWSSLGISNVTGLQTALDGKYDKLTDHYLFTSFSMIENESPQYILLCRNSANNNVNGILQINRTSGNYQAANLDVVVSSGASVGIQGGSLISNQAYQQTIPNEEKYDLVTLTRTSDSSSWIAIRYQGNTFPSTTATFTGYLQSTSSGFLTALGAGSVTSVTVFNTNSKVNFSASNVEIQENKVWHEGNDGTGSGLDADLLDGNHASAFALDNAVVKLTGSQSIAGTKTFTDSIFLNGSINSDGGTIQVNVDSLNVDGAIAAEGTLTGTRFVSTQATGTAPLTVASTTAVANLNADLLDGQHESYFINTSSSSQQKTGKLAIGSGTVLSDARLHVLNDTNFGIVLENTSTSASIYNNLIFKNNAGNQFATSIGQSTETSLGVANKFYLFDVTSSAVRYVVDSTGNMGIGTTSPLNKLDLRITGADSNDGILISRTDATTTTNEILGGIGFDSTDGNVPSSILEASAYIAAFAAEDHSVGDKGGYLTFGTAPIDQDDDTVSIERMRITSAGNVGIGTIAPQKLLSLVTSSNGDGLQIRRNSTTTNDHSTIGFTVSTVEQPLNLAEIRGVRTNRAVGADTDLRFLTQSNGTLGERMTIRDDGNVGIGINNPAKNLEISQALDGTTLRITSRQNDASHSSSTPFGSLEFYSNDQSGAGVGVRGSIKVLPTGASGATSFMTFSTSSASSNDNEAIRINENGLVGINETSPTAQLQVKSGAVGRVPLIIDTLASQTANLAEFKLNTATRLVVTKDGKIQAGSGDGEIHVTSQGVRIETLADNAFVPLTVNKDDTNTSAYLQQWQSATNTVAYVDETGEMYAPTFVSINGASSGSLSLQGSPFISRNINDATATLTVNNANASSTGNLLDLQAAGTNIISFKKDGTLLAPATFTIDPSGHGDITGKVIILGDLQVDGTTTTINSTTLEIDDKNIELSKGATNKAASDGAGITIDLGTDGTASLLYGSTADAFTFNKGLTVSGTLIANESIRIGDGGTYTNGSIYSDASWGMIFRARRASPSQAHFRFANSADSELMRIDTSGNVGIGTTTPSKKLDVSGDIKLSGSIHMNNSLIYGAIDTTYNDNGTFGIAHSPEYPDFGIFFTDGGNDYVSISPNGGGNTNPVMFIGGNDKVGIGTITPDSLFEIKAATPVMTINGTTNNSFRGINLQASGTTFASLLHNSSTGETTLTSGKSGDTGYFLTFDTLGVERMRITDTGNVGIGTTAPTEKLESVGSDATTFSGFGIFNTVAYTGSGKAEAMLKLGKIEGTVRQPMGAIGASPTNNGDSSNGYLSFYTRLSQAMNERMRIDRDGNIGIGTTTPQDLLNIHNSSANANIGFKITRGTQTHGLRLGVNDTHAFLWTTENQNLAFATNNAQRMTITAAGNVGIGTTTPSALLTINAGELNGAFAVQGLATNDYIATFRDSDGENVFKASGSVADSDLVVAFGDVNEAGSAVNYKILSDKHVFSGSVGIGTSSSALSDTLTVNGSAKVGSLKIDDIHVQDTATVTTTATTQTVLATYAVATYATGKFMIQATTGVNRHISELLVTHNGTVSTATEYAILKTAGNLFTVTTDISGGNVRILVTSASATSTVYKTTFTLIGV